MGGLKINKESIRPKIFKLTDPSFFVSFSMNFGEIVSSQSSDVYDLMSFRICAGASDGQISQMLSTSASDLRDCIRRAASVRDEDGVMTASDYLSKTKGENQNT